MKNKEFKEEFDNFAQDYRDSQDKELALTGEDSDYFARYKVYKFVSWFPLLQQQSLRILDFGCGDGLMSRYLAYYFNNSKIVGVDISGESIAIAKKKYPNIDFFKIENKLCFENKEELFDLIFVAGVFHHIPFDQHLKWVDELSCYVKPGGKLVIFELNPLNPGTQWIFFNHPMEKNAQMLKPWYATKLFSNIVNSTLNIKYFCFFPGWLSWLRPIEPYLEWCFLGGLYSLIIQKNK